MRILMITPFFPPQNTVASLRMHPFACAWAEAGEHVTVLTTAKRNDQRGLELPRSEFEVVEVDYHVPAVFERLRRSHKADSESSNGQLKSSSISAVSTTRHRTGMLIKLLRRVKERSGAFSGTRMPDLTHYWVEPALQWCRAQRENPWDVVVSSSGPYTAHLLAMALKRERLAQSWVADFRDLWTDNHLHFGLFPFTIRERVLERRCLAEADLLVTVSEGFGEALRRKSPRPVEVIYNGFNSAALSAIAAESIFPADGRVRLVYTGTFYPRGQEAWRLMAALRDLRRRNESATQRFQLVVAGSQSDLWNGLALRYDVADMVDCRGTVSHSDVLRMQRDADALLLLDWNDPTKGWLSAKLAEYLPARAPIIAIGGRDDSAVAGLIRRAGRGVHIGADIGRIAALLADLIERRMQDVFKPDNDFIATLSRENQSRRLLECLRQIAEKAAPTPAMS